MTMCLSSPTVEPAILINLIIHGHIRGHQHHYHRRRRHQSFVLQLRTKIKTCDNAHKCYTEQTGS